MFKPSSGRKTESGVWTHFIYDANLDQSKCIVRLPGSSGGDDGACGSILVGKNCTNLKNHLRSKHKKLFDELLSNEIKLQDTWLKQTVLTSNVKMRVGHCNSRSKERYDIQISHQLLLISSLLQLLKLTWKELLSCVVTCAQEREIACAKTLNSAFS